MRRSLHSERPPAERGTTLRRIRTQNANPRNPLRLVFTFPLREVTYSFKGPRGGDKVLTCASFQSEFRVYDWFAPLVTRAWEETRAFHLTEGDRGPQKTQEMQSMATTPPKRGSSAPVASLSLNQDPSTYNRDQSKSKFVEGNRPWTRTASIPCSAGSRRD